MTCKNCLNFLAEESDYCNSCGAKVIRNRLTIKNLFEDFSATFLNYDNKFLRTFVDLFKKPEDVIGSYIHGTRKKYVDVISYFALALTISGIQTFLVNKFFPEVMSTSFLSQPATDAFSRNNLSSIQEYQSILYMLAVPLYAFISKIVFWKYKIINYTEHLVINMYLSAHFAIISAVLIMLTSLVGINYIFSAMIIVPAQIIYSAFAFKRVLNLNMEAIILRTIKFLMILFIVMLIYTLVVISIMIASGQMDQIIESKKAVQGR